MRRLHMRESARMADFMYSMLAGASSSKAMVIVPDS